MIQRGELPVVKLGRLTRVPAAAVEGYVRERWERSPRTVVGQHLER